jgi:glycerol-3-phosphate acyltransferase PlsY
MGDILKGTLPVLAVRALGAGDASEVTAALFAVLGATRSVWVGFKGGRGIATGFGTALAIAPVALAAAAPIFIIIIWRTRLVSLGSLAAVAAFAPIAIILRMQTADGISIWMLAYSIVGPSLVWLAHADNIARLRAGTERTFDAGALTRD